MFAVIRDLYRNDKRFAFGFTVLAFFVIIAFVSRFAPYDMRAWNTVPRDLRPSLQHPLGTNSIGQDIMWKAMAAIKNSLLLGVIAAAISRVIAIVVGLLSGYKGGLFDRVVMVLTDSFIIIPLFPILILIATILRSSLNMVVLGIVIGLFGWAWDARLFRSQILSLKEREFTRTAVFSGLKTFKIVTTEHLPYIVPLVMATTINNVIWVIGMEVTLSMLGLSNLNTPTIGTMIYWALQYQAIFLERWNWILTPVIICVVLILALYMLSTSISEYLDPRTRLQMIRKR
ncbi:MAG: ABC transporter permease [Limnochordia bacterium]|nr:ABC transporter permease [Limnochordia bacterium]MDI9465830.1 ABC transporter permease [Bacillota bacterium]NLO96244.1 ABC transporter permease [Bacillota bacterium]HAN94763.1 peptide ABC transporter [Bacillota bacterium]HOB41189.1 ABC transporter permease [Limnochordia bacterium]